MTRTSLVSILLLVFLTTVACGQRKSQLSIEGFEEYVTLFEERSSEIGSPLKVADLVIEFGDLANPRERGACEIIGDQTPRVIISRTKWEKLDEASRRQLLFHELGHCVLFREHQEGRADTGIPLSLMHPYAIDSYTYSQFEDYYTEELFKAE